MTGRGTALLAEVDEIMMRITFAMFAITVSSCLRCLADDGLESANCAAMLESLRATYDSVERYDILISVERQEEGKEFSFNRRNEARVICDKHEESLLIVTQQEERNNFNTLMRSEIAAELVRDGTRIYTKFEEPPRNFPFFDLETHLTDASVPNVFLIGPAFFPNISHKSEPVDRVWRSVVGTVKAYGEASSQDKLIFCVAESPLKPGGFTTKWKFWFDPKTSLPTRYSCDYLSGDPSEEEREEYPRYSSTFSWCEPTPGIYLPESLTIRESIVVRSDSGESLPGKATTTVDIEWISVNEKIDPKMWDADELADFAKAKAMCKSPAK